MTRIIRVVLVIVAVFVAAQAPSAAQSQAVLSGTVVDTLGARLAGATVTLLREGQKVQDGKSDSDGTFSFTGLAPDRYQVQASLPGFQSKTSEAVFLGQGGRIVIEVTLEIGPLQQDVVVTAGATEQLQSQNRRAGDRDRRGRRSKRSTSSMCSRRCVSCPPRRSCRSASVAAPTSLFLRGGESNFTKVLIDGIPANDIGGGFDFSQLTLASVERIEVLRQTNSVIYGSDALTGVVNISTRRGTSRVPALDYMIDGGNLGTFNNALSFGGAYKRFDYFSQYSYYTTDNDVPNNGYRNGTYAGRFGVAVGNGTNVYGTVRYLDGRYRQPEWLRLCIASPTTRCPTPIRPTSAWRPIRRSARAGRRTVRFGSTNQESLYTNPTPIGHSVRSVWLRRELPGRDRDAHGCRRTNGHRAGAFSTTAARTRVVPVAHGAPVAVRPGNVPVDARPGDFGRRPLRARGRLQRSRCRPDGHAQQRRRVRRGTRDAGEPRLHQRRHRRGAQRGLRDRRTRRGCRWRRTCVILPTSRSARRR